MDSTRFDDLLRGLARGVSRRATIGAALSGLFASGSLALLADDAEAKKKHKKKKKKKCKSGTKKCGKKCIPANGCCTSSECGANGTCVGNACQCASGFKDCNGTCIPQDDCCPACTGGQVCVAETCQCPDGQQECEGACISADDCCPACGGGGVCDGGVCVCDPGSIDCGNDCCDPGDDEVCHITTSNQTCDGGGCPPSNYCVDEDYFQCGDNCACITSVEDVNACSDLLLKDCTDCTSDAQCTTVLGQEALCIPTGEFCTNCAGNTNFCVATGCPSFNGTCPVTDYCADPETFNCGADCVCTTTVDPSPENACVESPFNVTDCVGCTSNLGCATGEVCIASGEFCGESCGAAFCWPLCAEGLQMAAERSAGRSRKGTSAAKASGGKRRDRQRHSKRKRGGHRQHHRS